MLKFLVDILDKKCECGHPFYMHVKGGNGAAKHIDTCRCIAFIPADLDKEQREAWIKDLIRKRLLSVLDVPGTDKKDRE